MLRECHGHLAVSGPSELDMDQARAGGSMENKHDENSRHFLFHKLEGQVRSSLDIALENIE
jgi:hypothetical protein